MPDAPENLLPPTGTRMHGMPPPESPDSLNQTVARRSTGRLRSRAPHQLPRGIAALLAFGQLHCDRCGTPAWPVDLEPGPALVEILCKECIAKAD